MNSKKRPDQKFKKERRKVKKEQQQGDILLLVRNFTWTIDPLNQEAWPKKNSCTIKKRPETISVIFNCTNCQLPV